MEVPTNDNKRPSPQLPQVDPKFLLMAAVGMHQAGKLPIPTSSLDPDPNQPPMLSPGKTAKRP